MAPIKFEEHIKDQLEERRITPSVAGWERVAGQLDVQQGKKKSKRLLWLSIAASFIIGVGVTAVILQNTTDSNSELVDNPEGQQLQENQQETIDKLPVLEDLVKEQEELVEVKTPTIKSEKKASKTTPSKPMLVIKPGIVPNQFQEAVAVIDPSISEEKNSIQEVQLPIKNTTALELGITQKVSEAVAQVSQQELVTDAEIEDLLRNAQRDISADQLFQLSATRVDANALLLDVEAVVDPERFRDKIFRTLKSEFGKAVEAVANKDN